jgi:Domain of unknown function (DUF4345)
MTASSLLNLSGALLTTGLGIVGLLSPQSTARMIGIKPSEPRGVSEIRATYGGMFLSLGVLALYSQNVETYTAIGCGWIGAAIARVFSILVDRQLSKLNIGGVLLEGGIGMLLLHR